MSVSPRHLSQAHGSGQITGNRLLDCLIETGGITSTIARAAMDHEKQVNVEEAETYLLTNRLVTSDVLAQAIASVYDIRYMDAKAIENMPVAREWAEANGGLRSMIQDKKILPLMHARGIVACIVANKRKSFTGAIDFVRQLDLRTGNKAAIPIISTDPVAVGRYIHAALEARESTSAMLDRFERKIRDLVDSSADDKVSQIFILLTDEAIKSGASDIHVEPGVESASIRFRIEGELTQAASIPIEISNSMCSHILAKANKDADAHKAVDGKIHMSYKVGTEIQRREMRLTSRQSSRIGLNAKTFNVTHMSIRLLNYGEVIPSLSELGYSDDQAALLKQMMFEPRGCLVMTGPTGEGKTTTLASLLNMRRGPDVRIISAEDPVEIFVPMIDQHEVTKHFTFAEAIKYFLRADPDIMMIGEIRDFDALKQGVFAAITGHLFLASLHTGDAISTLDRLEELGKSDSSTLSIRVIIDALNAIVAQRLLLKLCSECSTRVSFAEFQKRMPGWMLQYGHIEQWFAQEDEVSIATQGSTCRMCHGKGYTGRTAIAEILQMTPEFRDFLRTERAYSSVQKYAIEHGFATFHHEARGKILGGVFDIAMVAKVIGKFPKYQKKENINEA